MRLNRRIISAFIAILIVQTVAGLVGVVAFVSRDAEMSVRDEVVKDLSRGLSVLNTLSHDLLSRFYLMQDTVHYVDVASGDEASLSVRFENFVSPLWNGAVLAVDGAGLVRVLTGRRSLPSVFQTEGIHQLLERDFSFPRGEYLAFPEAMDGNTLFYVVGGNAIDRNQRSWKLYLIVAIDHHFIDSLSFQTGFSYTFFLGSTPLANNFAPFPIKFDAAGYNEPREFQIEGRPYMLVSSPLQPESGTVLHFSLLKSVQNDSLVLNRVTSFYVALFVVLLGVSLIMAYWLTQRMIAPLVSLESWVSSYRKGQDPDPVLIKSGDEIAFMADSIYGMVKKIVDEEAIIRSQLEEITGLNAFSEVLLKNIQAGIVTFDVNGRIAFANSYIAELLEMDRETLEHKQVQELLGSKLRFAGGLFPALDYREEITLHSLTFVAGPGKDRLFVLKMTPMDVVERSLLVLEDITESEQLWRSTLTAEKIASLGQLSAGLAHEINNPLGAILSHVDFLQAVEHDVSKSESLTWIRRETERIVALVSRVLSFAHTEPSLAYCDPVRICDDILGLLTLQLSKVGICIRTEYSSAGIIVALPPDDLKQVLLNLLNNAIQAIGRNGNIIVKISSGFSAAVVEIDDDGSGIEAEVLPRLFDPFFTTKSEGEGSGLGLFVAYRIIRRCGGTLEIENKQSRGAVARLMVPVYEVRNDDSDH